MTVDLVLTNAKAYVNNKIVECYLTIDNGKIRKIGKTDIPDADETIDLENLLVLPGLIDAHVHLRDEGKAYKEDFCSGTAAAAAGGITTVLDMPNNDPVTMSADAARNRMEKAEKNILINVGFFSEFPRRLEELKETANQGVIAFKLFMAQQVGGLDINDDSALLEAFKIIRKLRKPVAFHAEDKTLIETREARLKEAKSDDIDAFLEAHSEEVETRAVSRLLNIVKRTGIAAHFCHISTEKALEAIKKARTSGIPATCEATPHHLLLTSKDLKRVGTTAVTMPPIRQNNARTALWNGIKSHLIDTVGSDHAPHTADEKRAKSIWDVKAGIPGLETMLPLLLTEINHGTLTISDIVRLMSEKPAEIFRLKGRGHIRIGNNADLTVVDLKKKDKIDPARFYSKAKFSPFEGRLVEGKPVKAFVKGRLVMDNGEIVAKAGCGKIIRGN